MKTGCGEGRDAEPQPVGTRAMQVVTVKLQPLYLQKCVFSSLPEEITFTSGNV
jgi:hypothetical protein